MYSWPSWDEFEFSCAFIIFKLSDWGMEFSFLNFTSQKIKPGYFLILGETRRRVQSRLANRKRGPEADTRLHGSFCGTKANCDRGVKVLPLGVHGDRWKSCARI
jgi:hypothetical protein